MISQICYTSKSTITKDLLLTDLIDIMTSARHFTYKNGISGFLYYANGYFFECLEGKTEALRPLLTRLLESETRHCEIQMFEQKRIKRAFFADWSMLYISKRSQLNTFCKANGFDLMQPQYFQQENVNKLIQFVATEFENIQKIENLDSKAQ